MADAFQPGAAEVIDTAVSLARALQLRAAQLQTPHERRQQAELDRMLQTPADKITLVQLTDQAFRCAAAARTAEHLTHILDVQGVPRFFSPLDRALLHGFQTFGGWLPGVAVPLVKEHMQHETANVVLPAEPELLAQHLRARQQEGTRMNLNFLGEALLGEDEAARRLEKYLEALQLPEVEVLSVKISTLYSQISPLARAHTLRVLCDRLELLFREAAHLRHTRADGVAVPKFIYLDMEEYRDLHLTAQSFMRTLDRPGLSGIAAGIALQAYLPDSARVQRELLVWARVRVAAGGAPITIRIVKGANMEMERVEAAQRGWPQTPFKTKRETDANYKRMLHESLRAENLAAARVGVASHNLFDLAYGVVLAAASGAGDRVQFEMLEGMANHQRRALREHTSSLLLYAPACRKEEFLNAVGYLLRRLDENTGPDNFLRHAFRLHVDSPDWHQLEKDFRQSFAVPVSDAPRRTQDRNTEPHTARAAMDWQHFENEPDTDFALSQNVDWATRLVANTAPDIADIPLVIAGEEIRASASLGECSDPSHPGKLVARYHVADSADIERAVACAKADPDGWRTATPQSRSTVLGRVAMEIRRARGRLIHAALANGGKTVAEADPEVSEAVDFVEFYRATASHWHALPGLRACGWGVVAVVPPWNFPIAIPCGGIAAALAAGNTVILKPASDAVLPAWELCQCFWRGGVPRTALQFAPCPGSGAGARLTAHADVNAVILTGGTDTALCMLRARPTLRLFAETGGKNAIIITALSDRELAIRHVVQSAFGHGGQKCSAASLLLLEAEVYDSEDFKRMLCDAARSLPVGSAWDVATRIGPLIRPPADELEAALKTLEPGESWALMPQHVGDNPNLWSPGVKYGVRPGSVTHRTEFFGPLLGVMRFERLAEAIECVNQTGYGLTSGLHSLDEREHAQWAAGIRAGNLYINRTITGALVLRQPFGGMGKSCLGHGMKAGGPNYVAQLMQFEETAGSEATADDVQHPHLMMLRDAVSARDNALPAGDCARLFRALASYDRAWRQEFSRAHDHFHLPGQDNLRRYLPFREIRVRVARDDTPFELFARVAAARVTGARVVVSLAKDFPAEAIALLDACTADWAGAIEFIEETDAALARVLARHDLRVRFAAADHVSPALRIAANECCAWLADEPVLAEGCVELLWYLREQSLCHDYHRYGNLGARGDEPRSEPA